MPLERVVDVVEAAVVQLVERPQGDGGVLAVGPDAGQRRGPQPGQLRRAANSASAEGSARLGDQQHRRARYRRLRCRWQSPGRRTAWKVPLDRGTVHAHDAGPPKPDTRTPGRRVRRPGRRQGRLPDRPGQAPARRTSCARPCASSPTDQCTDLAAALTYYAVLAIFPAAHRADLAARPRRPGHRGRRRGARRSSTTSAARSVVDSVRPTLRAAGRVAGRGPGASSSVSPAPCGRRAGTSARSAGR